MARIPLCDLRAGKAILMAIVLILGSLPGLVGASAQSGKTVNLEIIVDQSGSMAAATDTGVLRIDAARNVLNEVIAQIPEDPGVNVGFRVYGHLGNNQPEGQAESCVSSDLLVPMQGVDKAALTSQVNAILPVGWTPLGYSLQEAAKDFTQPASEDVVNAIIMVTDGLETCGADPAAIAGELKGSDAGITTHVIGFGTKPEELAILEGITQASGGQLLGSNNAGQLMDALFSILETLEVVQETGDGASGASPIALGRSGRVGDYDVTILSAIPSSDTAGTTGGVNFTVRVSVTYRGDQFGEAARDLDFTARGESGIRYQLRDFGCPGQSGIPQGPKLFRGGSSEFSICWTIAPNDTETLLLTVAPRSNLGSQSAFVWFSLGRVSADFGAKTASEVEVVAQDIRYSGQEIVISANTDVTIVIYNEGMLEHDFVIDALAVNSGPIQSQQSATVSVNLPAGEYTFYCSIPGHKEAGMTGTLIVE